MNQNGGIEYANNMMVKTFGYTLQEISHVQQWMEVAYPDTAYRDEVWKQWIERFQDWRCTKEKLSSFHPWLRILEKYEYPAIRRPLVEFALTLMPETNHAIADWFADHLEPRQPDTDDR